MATIHVYRNKLKAAARFMAVQDIRFYLNGLLIESNPMQSRIVATDGHTLFASRDDAKGDNAGAFVGIMPADTVKAILSWKALQNRERCTGDNHHVGRSSGRASRGVVRQCLHFPIDRR